MFLLQQGRRWSMKQRQQAGCLFTSAWYHGHGLLCRSLSVSQVINACSLLTWSGALSGKTPVLYPPVRDAGQVAAVGYYVGKGNYTVCFKGEISGQVCQGQRLTDCRKTHLGSLQLTEEGQERYLEVLVVIFTSQISVCERLQEVWQSVTYCARVAQRQCFSRPLPVHCPLFFSLSRHLVRGSFSLPLADAVVFPSLGTDCSVTWWCESW